jgi:hypothetical protein
VPSLLRGDRRRIGVAKAGLGCAWWIWGCALEEVLRNADGCWRMGDDGGIHTAQLKRCQKSNSRHS